MSVREPGPPADLAERAARFDAKSRAELDRADRVAPGSDVVASDGDRFATLMFVKGDPGPAEIAGGPALSGPDGDAARKALKAMGFDPTSLFATVARPEAGIDQELLAKRLRLQIEAIDPYGVVALDRVAAGVLTAATGVLKLPMGRPVSWMGRSLLAVDGLESSLADETAKRRVWNQLKALTPRRPVL